MPSGKLPSPLAAALAAATGLTGLILELLWVRLLGIETGGPLTAFAIILTCFMLGTAGGAALFGRIADSTRSPAGVFGLGQIGVGLLGIITYLAAGMGGLARPLLRSLELAPGDPGFGMVPLFTSGLVSGAAAFLAGGALPLLVRGFDSDAPLTRRAGRLAAFQAAGGAAGSILCGFVLLPLAGLRVSLLVVSFLAILTGLVALVFRGRSPMQHVPLARETSVKTPDTARAARLAVPAALLASGAALTILEVAWMRLSSLSFGSSIQAASLVLMLVISCLAAGYASGARASVRTTRPGRSLALVLAAAALMIVMSDLVFGRLPMIVTWFDRWLETDTAASLWRVPITRCLVLLLPVGLPSLLLGAVYPLALRLGTTGGMMATHDGRDTGRASAVTAIGYMAGPPLAWFGIIGWLGSRGCLLIPALGLGLAGLLSARVERGGGIASRLLLAVISLVVITAVLAPWDPILVSSGPYLYASYYRTAMEQSEIGMRDALRLRGDLLFSNEGPDSLVTVRRSAGGLLSLQVNGKTDASTGGDLKTQSLTAHLPLLARSLRAGAPPRVLVVGLGSGVTAASALAHPVGEVDVIEISPGVVEAASYFSQVTGDPLRDPKVRLLVGDVRTRLLFPGNNPALYDIIMSQPSNPWIEGQAILFTKEFFELAASRLAPGGLMCQWLQGQGLPADDFRSILATFKTAFAHVSLWEESTAGGDYLLLGSQEPIRFYEAELRARMSDSALQRDLARIEMSGPAELLSHHVASGERLSRLLPGATIQSDDRIALEFTAPATLRGETLGEILAMLEPARSGGEDLITGSPALIEELARRQLSARSEREWAAGLGLLAPSLELDPDLVRAASYLAAGMRAHALESIRSMILKNPSRRTPHLMAAHLLMSTPGGPGPGELAEVIRELKVAVRLDPAEPRARLFLSRALRVAGFLRDALVENTAIPSPRPPVADSDRCAMFLESGDPASAEAACLEAIARDPALAAAHANLGVVRSRRGRAPEAEQSYLRALDLDPTLADTRYNLAALYERQGRHREGLERLRPLVSSSVADAATLILAARLALEAGDPGEARAFLDRSVAREGRTAESEEIEQRLRPAADAR